MAGENAWLKINSTLENNPTEVATVQKNRREPLWFKAYIENSYICIENAEIHKPSTNLTKRRRISKKFFLRVYPYYHRWASGELGVRQEARDLSVNLSYIFALIAKYDL